jgi:putative ABC transport system permease protein
VKLGLWWRLAWRNLGRNRRRSFITGAALAFGYMAAVLMVAFSDGLTREMVRNGTEIVSGQGRVVAPDFLPERNLYATLGGDAGVDVGRLLNEIRSTPGVEAAAPRVYAGGLVSSGPSSGAVLLLGFDPEREPRVSRLLGALVEGRVPRPGARELVVGRELARRLGVRTGQELVVVAPAADGSLGNDLFRVTGLFATGVTEMDDGYALAPLGALQALLALGPGRVHEVAIAVSDPWAADSVMARVGRRLKAAGVAASAESWTSFRPELVAYARLADSSNLLIVGIVFLMAVFGVANTMLMGTYERRREFALVEAVGGSPGGIVATVVCEGVILGLLALVAGALLTAPLMVWWYHSPPDLSRLFGGFTMAGALVRPVLLVQPSVRAPLVSAAALLITAVVAAAYPAVRASRVPPADALSGR